MACAHTVSAWNNSAFPFKSRPDLNPQPIDFTTYHKDLVSQEDGYIFLSPYIKDPSLEYQLDVQATPVVYDESYLVGLRAAGTAYTFNAKVQGYNGKPHITFFAGGFSNGGLDFGRNVILDQSYKFADTVVSGHGRASGDAHLFNALPGDTAMISILQPRAYDLMQLGVNQTYGWVLDSLLQEIDLKKQKVLFE